MGKRTIKKLVGLKPDGPALATLDFEIARAERYLARNRNWYETRTMERRLRALRKERVRILTAKFLITGDSCYIPLPGELK